MQREDFVILVNNILQEKYSLTISDTGYSITEWLDRFGEMPAEDAVRCYAEKYDLISTYELSFIEQDK